MSAERSDAPRPCFLVPIHDDGRTIGAVVEGLLPYELPILIVDDGSGAETAAVLDRLVEERAGRVELIRHAHNRGKGAALKTGYRAALERGHSHAVQLDADGQHDTAEAPRFLDALHGDPSAHVLGYPVFDDSVPWARLAARQLSRGIVWLTSLSFAVRDPLVGYRAVPLASTVALMDRIALPDHMELEPELAVRLCWEGLPVVNVPASIVYPEGGSSHFSFFRDYPKLARRYLLLAAGMLVRAPALILRSFSR